MAKKRSAERCRRLRARRAEGLCVLPMEVAAEPLWRYLVAHRFLPDDAGDDRRVLAAAGSRLLAALLEAAGATRRSDR